MKLIVGLGNPGDKYKGTRHNLGFELIDDFRRKREGSDWEVSKKFKAEISNIGQDLLLLRPQTFMNLSGQSVGPLAKFYKIDPIDIILIHDELDLVLGHIKLRVGGSDAGHHGVESVINGLGTDKFIRLRLGIGTLKSLSGEHKKSSFNAEKFVVEDFLGSEKSKVRAMIKRSIQALDIVLRDGIEKAQNQFN